MKSIEKKEGAQANLDHLNWDNATMSQYYENVPIADVKQFAKIGGLDSGKDLEAVSQYIKAAHSILEIGAGYGRVLQLLLQQYKKADITAIERSHSFCEHIRKHFTEEIKLIEGNVTTHTFACQYDLLLLMWSHVCEYPQAQQADFIKHIATLAKTNGIMVIESFNPHIKPINSSLYNEDQQTFMYESEHGSVHGYIPTLEQLKTYALRAQLTVVEQKSYLTTTGRKRFLTVLKKTP